MNTTDETVEKVGQFITKHPIQTRDYTFGEVQLILERYTDDDLSKFDESRVDEIFGKYGKGSLVDSVERQTIDTRDDVPPRATNDPKKN